MNQNKEKEAADFCFLSKRRSRISMMLLK